MSSGWLEWKLEDNGKALVIAKVAKINGFGSVMGIDV